MSVVEDTRKVMQDFLAPELRAISVRLDALEKRFDDAERRADKRHDEVMTALSYSREVNSLREREARPEAKDNPPQ